MYLVSFAGAVIDDLRFINCTFRGLSMSDVVQHAGSISFKDVTLEPAKKSRSLNSRDSLP
jgi:unsaturated rhamnogalacturonyl hydrolase